jgi:hypothetical protein
MERGGRGAGHYNTHLKGGQRWGEKGGGPVLGATRWARKGGGTLSAPDDAVGMAVAR